MGELVFLQVDLESMEPGQQYSLPSYLSLDFQ